MDLSTFLVIKMERNQESADWRYHMEGMFKEPTLLNIFPLYCLFPHPFLNKERIPEWVAIPFFRGSSLTQGLNPGFLHYRQILYHLSHQGSQIRQNYITKSITYTLYLHFGEGNGNPLQCSCLENPRDNGALWAAACRVTQSQTQLK